MHFLSLSGSAETAAPPEPGGENGGGENGGGENGGGDPVAFCSNTHNAASASRSDVLAAIALTSPGDCVVVPPGTASWSGGITISGISLIGPGKDAGSPTNITAGLVEIDKHSTAYTRLIGFRFTGTDHHVLVSGDGKPFVVHDNYMLDDGSGDFVVVETNGGLFSKNYFDTTTIHAGDTFRLNGGAGYGAAQWALPTTLGDDDTDGETNLYFESNTWKGFAEVAFDVDEGIRAVARYNTFIDSSMVVHGGGGGGGGQDTSYAGGRQVELYNNVFDRVSNSFGVNKWIWLRGATGVIANNTFDRADSPDGSSYPNKPEIRLSVGCGAQGSSYPKPYQVGQNSATPDATPDQPLLIFGNTGAGTTDPNFLIITENGTGGGGSTECANPETYIQLNRDYRMSNYWGWTPFTYPHPLRPDIDELE